jgi:aminocarboxymuconate-semialdehyde decarboxylase
MVMAIDVHNHFYPKKWLDYLEKRTESPRLEWKGPDSALFYSKNTVIASIRFPGHYDPEARIEDLAKFGIDIQILSFTMPTLDFLPAKQEIDWARRINDSFADVCQKFPGRFYSFTTLPFQDMDAAQKELERAYKELSMRGLLMFSNIQGRSIASPEFHPIYAMAEQYELPIFIHPAVPLIEDILCRDKIFGSVASGVYGYTLDTSLAVMSLIWYGVLEKFPSLRLIHSHTGGVVPYLAGRLEELWRLNPIKKPEYELPLTPNDYYRRQVYPDSVTTFLPAVRCCLEYVGSEHMVLGTDYAHRMGTWDRAVGLVKELGLSERDTNNILGDNAAKLFKID